jgi:hypothetical protein
MDLPGPTTSVGTRTDYSVGVTPDFTGKTECISHVRQDQFTHT